MDLRPEARPVRVTVLREPPERRRPEQDLFAAIGRIMQMTELDVRRRWPDTASIERSDPDVVLNAVKLRNLDSLGPLRCEVPIVRIEHDAFVSHTSWGKAKPWRETLPRLLQGHQLDLLFVSGLRSVEHLHEYGNVAWLPKGCDTNRFRADGGEARVGLCTFGSLYRSRTALRRKLQRAQVPVSNVDVDHDDLPATLRRFAGFVTTVLGATVRYGTLGRAIERLRPGTALTFDAAPEPMLKHFEASASGCGVLTDWTPDLSALGFVEEESVFVFRTLDEAVERARALVNRPELLVAAGQRAAEIVSRRHSWDHRAAQFDTEVRRLL